MLADLLRRQPPSPARTSFAWTVAVGPALARVTAVTLQDGVLHVSARDARWGREIERARDTILERVWLLIGRDAVTAIVVEQT
jgi:hypothetical protein